MCLSPSLMSAFYHKSGVSIDFTGVTLPSSWVFSYLHFKLSIVQMWILSSDHTSFPSNSLLNHCFSGEIRIVQGALQAQSGAERLIKLNFNGKFHEIKYYLIFWSHFLHFLALTFTTEIRNSFLCLWWNSGTSVPWWGYDIYIISCKSHNVSLIEVKNQILTQ